MSSVASVPHSTATMRNTCSSKIILPGALLVYRQVRNEKYRSVSRTIPCRLQARSPQSEEKVLLPDPLYCDACLAIPAQSQWKWWADKIYFDSDQVRSTQSQWKAIPQSWTAIDIHILIKFSNIFNGEKNMGIGNVQGTLPMCKAHYRPKVYILRDVNAW